MNRQEHARARTSSFAFDPEVCREEMEVYAAWVACRCSRLAKRVKQAFEVNPEGVVLEARTLQLLREEAVDVDVGESIEGGGFDFECSVRGARFSVEVTSVGIKPVVDKLGIPEEPRGPVSYAPFASWLSEHTLTLERKQKQLKKADKPLLLVVGSPHFMSSSVQVDSILLEWTYCPPDHGCSLWQRCTAGTDDPLIPAEVSGMLFFPAGAVNSRTGESRFLARGVLAPVPLREFDSSWLPSHLFCEFYAETPSGDPVCRWYRGSPRRMIRRPQ